MPGDADGNLAIALGAIESLGAADCDLIVLPEYMVTGCSARTLKADMSATAEPLDGPRGCALADAARAANSWLVAGTVPERVGDGVYNTSTVYSPTGELVQAYRKCHLYRPIGEDRAMLRGTELATCETDDLGVLGLSVCFDGDFPEVARGLRRLGAQLVVQPSAYGSAARRWWKTLYPANALVNSQWWILANQCGVLGDASFLGESMIITPRGKVLRRARNVHDAEEHGLELMIEEIPLRRELDIANREQGILFSDLRAEAIPLRPDGQA
jgi:predicted amidohydrolase